MAARIRLNATAGRRVRDTLADSTLVRLIGCTIAAIVTWFVLRVALPEPWHTPGSPELYVAGVLGVALLLVPAAFSVAKRSGPGRDPLRWFSAHVWCACAGAVLIAIHSGGFVRRAPALLLALLLALAVLGVWARLRGSRMMAATFGSKFARFEPPDDRVRARLRELIGLKRDLLAELEPDAAEATFSPTLRHLVRSPRLAIRYGRYAREESVLLGTRAAVGTAQAWWRPLHMAFAWLFVAGVLVHVVTVTLFAGWVADYGPVHWWHLARW
ncbi:MAG: hypothetical protein KJZ83_04570 [Burkholderiaceae bacterium]|nr:hypothetical protein [Burkholderiaceae bacterium]